MSVRYSERKASILEAISLALSDSCGKIDDQIESDFQTLGKERDEALNESKDALARVSKLQTENARLKAELQETRQRLSQPSEKHVQGRPVGGKAAAKSTSQSSSKDGVDWKAECARVSLKFNALSDNFKKAKDALRKRKDERDRWADHATLLEKRIKAAEEEHGIRIIDRGNKNIRTTTDSETRTEESKSSPNTSFVSEGGLDQADLELPPLAAESLQSDEAVNLPTTARSPESESTQGDSESRQGSQEELPSLPQHDPSYEVRIKEEPSSDGPVVVSARPVRKRRRDSPDVDATPAQRVKMEETQDSSPIMTFGHSTSDLQESIDLGDVVQRLMTPRKRKDMEDSRQDGYQRDARSTSARPHTSDSLYVRPDSNPQPAPMQPALPRAPEYSSALTPVSVNKRLTRPTFEKPPLPSPPLRKDFGRAIESLAEDGGGYQKETDAKQPQVSGVATPLMKGRLDKLLNTPAPTPQGSITPLPQARQRQTPGTLGSRQGRPRNVSDELPVPQRRELPFERSNTPKEKSLGQLATSRSIQSVASNRATPQNTKSPLAFKGAGSALRSKPVSELRLEDFKVNPLVNEGHDFAFTEVVRDRDERSRLQGCTDMHCCGKQFRALALSQRPNPPLTAQQRQEEQKLLEEYLGDSAYRLATMSREDREELWVEAKTQELANKYGKHRHQFSRMRSPPGFWNADFPSTQELELERAEASKREKAAVRERHREALRPDGRWMFRDE